VKSLLRILAFVGKEIRVIAVQPQLLLLLVAGPFVVLLAFGLGYQPQGTVLRTIVVQPATADPRQAVGSYLTNVGPPIRVVQVTTDWSQALMQLRTRQVDLAVVVPPGITDTLLAGQHAHLVFYHNEIDPLQVGYIAAVVDGVTSALNRSILTQAVGSQQATASDYEQALLNLQSSLDGIRTALLQGDRPRAQELARRARADSELVATLWFFASVPLTDQGSPPVALTNDARQLDQLFADPNSDPAAVSDAITKMQFDTDRLLQALQHTRQIPPDVLVSPFVWETKSISSYQPSYVAYHSPTVLALLVQHLCVTLAALSLVDEHSAGAIEVFRAAPLNSAEILIGKFLAYVLIITVVVAGLVAILIYGLHVPLLGDWRWFAAVMGTLVTASLGFGFLISALARSRSQAIQMSMLALLGSIFFSGFFIPLPDFAIPVRVISYTLPVTYGIEQLRQVMLRGETPQFTYLGALGIWTVALAFLSVRVFRQLFIAR